MIVSVIAAFVFLNSMFVNGADNLINLIDRKAAEIKNSCSENRAQVKGFYERILLKMVVQFHCEHCIKEKYCAAGRGEITKLYACSKELHNEDSDNITDNTGHFAHAIHEYTSPLYFYCRNRDELMKVGHDCFEKSDKQCYGKFVHTEEALSHFSNNHTESTLAALCKITQTTVSCQELPALKQCGAFKVNRWLKFSELVYRGLMSTYYEDNDSITVPNECVEFLDFLADRQIVNGSLALSPRFILIILLNYITGFQIFKTF
ncbi:hypothetical protein DdX_02761 [Ditylenchus destructor]|uniref:Uncharacterized protein n=1 Tax=Ditylenchus destructor TaxID=166010 RepID=A0AAD4NI62_9BILA|nr:hypothetical protein DdX_02761 [Ditylenchus destructor]